MPICLTGWLPWALDRMALHSLAPSLPGAFLLALVAVFKTKGQFSLDKIKGFWVFIVLKRTNPQVPGCWPVPPPFVCVCVCEREREREREREIRHKAGYPSENWTEGHVCYKLYLLLASSLWCFTSSDKSAMSHVESAYIITALVNSHRWGYILYGSPFHIDGIYFSNVTWLVQMVTVNTTPWKSLSTEVAFVTLGTSCLQQKQKERRRRKKKTCCFPRSSTISGRHAEGCLLYLACDWMGFKFNRHKRPEFEVVYMYRVDTAWKPRTAHFTSLVLLRGMGDYGSPDNVART